MQRGEIAAPLDKQSRKLTAYAWRDRAIARRPTLHCAHRHADIARQGGLPLRPIKGRADTVE